MLHKQSTKTQSPKFFRIVMVLIILITVAGCSPAWHCKLKKTDQRTAANKDIPELFSKSVNSYIFDCRIKIYGKQLSGILALKRMDNDTYRTVFMSKVGINFFDFEFSPTASADSISDFKIHYCLEALNRKALLKTLEQDLRLLMINYLPEKAIVLQNRKKDTWVYKFRKKKRKDYYYVADDTGKLTKIELCGTFSRKVIVNLTDYKDGFPETIKLVHKNIRLNIDFYFLKNS